MLLSCLASSIFYTSNFLRSYVPQFPLAITPPSPPALLLFLCNARTQRHILIVNLQSSLKNISDYLYFTRNFLFEIKQLKSASTIYIGIYAHVSLLIAMCEL